MMPVREKMLLRWLKTMKQQAIQFVFISAAMLAIPPASESEVQTGELFGHTGPPVSLASDTLAIPSEAYCSVLPSDSGRFFSDEDRLLVSDALKVQPKRSD